MTRLLLFSLLAGALLLPVHTQAQPTDNALNNLTKLQSGIQSKRVSSYETNGGNRDRFEDIKPGEKRVLFDVEGSGIINHIWITIAPAPPALSRNDIIIRMYWDGEENPSVEAPIGPFFGQGWNERYNYSSLPLSAGPAPGLALVSYFQFPFSDGARIEIENQNDINIDAFYFYIDYYEVEKLDENVGRFHAWYNHELTEALPDGENEWDVLGPHGYNTTGDDNYLLADIEGQGHYIGVNYYVHAPTPMWYGEGDDMFFIDGEAYPPSLHGTGTEDYFNTSWCPKEIYSHPYYGYARVNDDKGWLGRTHVYRFHITDPVYFDKSLRFSIEHGHNNALTLDLASVAYWYQKEPHKPFPPLISKEERAPKEFIGVSDIHRWRHEWRKNMGNDPQLWGKEKKENKE